MRQGLRPLSVHIGMATSYWSQAMVGNPETPQQLQDMLLGIQKYQTHSFYRNELPLHKIWQEGTVSLSSIPRHEPDPNQPPIILVPSLINKAYILDLMEERSMLRFLAAQNINTYLLDWGDIEEDNGAQDIDGVILGRLVPAIKFLREQEERPVHALGYCMGGTLLMGAASNTQEDLKSIIMLAAPWDFHAGSQALLNRVKFWAPSAFPVIDTKQVLPVDWMQILFASLDPAQAAQKFSNFTEMKDGSEEEQLFIAVEDWLNDGIDLPAQIAQHCIEHWFLKNLPAQSKWEIGGKVVLPEDIKCPVLIIASDKDRLVEFETAKALQDKIKGAELVNPSCGHIGMIAGRNAIEKVWQPIADWVQD